MWTSWAGVGAEGEDGKQASWQRTRLLSSCSQLEQPHSAPRSIRSPSIFQLSHTSRPARFAAPSHHLALPLHHLELHPDPLQMHPRDPLHCSFYV